MSTQVEAVIFLTAFFIVVPAIAALVGYAAWKGMPKGWDRFTYWTAFAASIMASGFLIVSAQRMQADIRTWQYVLQLALLGLGISLFGVAGGCMVGIFLYQRDRGPIWRKSTPQSERSQETSERDNHPSA